MKSLCEYIIEAKSSDWVRIDLKGLKLPDDFYSSIESIGSRTGLYTEKTDDGFKIRIKPGFEDKLEGFIDNLNFVYEKNKDDEKVKDVCDKLLAKIGKLMDIAQGDDDDDESEPEKKENDKKEDKKEDDKNKEGE